MLSTEATGSEAPAHFRILASLDQTTVQPSTESVVALCIKYF